MRISLLFAFLAVALGNGPIVKAVVDIYSSEASWQNAVNGTSLIDFDDLAPDTLLLSQYPGVTFSPFAAGEPRTSSFYTAYSGSNLVIAYPDLTHEANGGGDVQFVFDSPQGGFSFRHLYSQFINTVTLYDSADQVLDTIDSQAPRPLEWVFLGFASSANDIKKVSISVDPGDFVGFDDLSYAGSTTGQSVLVSNLSQPVRDATPIGNNPNPADPVGLPVTPWYWGAQSFQTDNQQHALASIDAMVGGGSNAPLPVVVAELRTDNEGVIGDLITTFLAPGVDGPDSARTFAPVLPVTLDPNTKYWFVLGSEDPGDGTYYWSYAEGNASEGNGVLGGFADTTESGVDWTYRSDNPYFIQVNVTHIVDPCALADLNSDSRVDGADLSVVFSNWGAALVGTPGNLNGDDVVDGADVATI
ncbi:MAG: hypothetical protein O2931_10060 [Planctomycetota bacterium]|nr:hypothetical protein [Planctomycetota bacterium]